MLSINFSCDLLYQSNFAAANCSFNLLSLPLFNKNYPYRIDHCYYIAAILQQHRNIATILLQCNNNPANTEYCSNIAAML